MSIYKWMAAFAMLALGAAVVLGLPALSPDVEAGLSASAIKADRLGLGTPEPVKLEQARPGRLEQFRLNDVKLEAVKPQQVPPEQAKPEQFRHDEVKPAAVKPERDKPKQAKPRQAKPRQAKAEQNASAPGPKAKRCADDTWAHYEMKCQKTRTRVVNGVRTTRIVPDRAPQE